MAHWSFKILNNISEHVVELSVCHRQSSDIEFSNLLDRVAVGEFNDKDYQTLSDCPLNVLSRSKVDKFNKVIHILATKEAVHERNEECLRKLNDPALNFRAVVTPSYSCNIHEETGLPAELFVAIGCQVMLTYNTWVEGVLANGTLRIVRAIVYL